MEAETPVSRYTMASTTMDSSLNVLSFIKGLTFSQWLEMMPRSTFENREDWQVEELLVRFSQVIDYTKRYYDHFEFIKENDYDNQDKDNKMKE